MARPKWRGKSHVHLLHNSIAQETHQEPSNGLEYPILSLFLFVPQ